MHMNKTLFGALATLLTGVLSSASLSAAPTLTSPADYATVSPKAAGLNGYNTTPANRAYTTYAPDTCKTAFRKNLASAYQASGVVRLSWSEAGTVEVRRARDGKVVFATTTAGTSADFVNPEIGRNYTWTVTSGSQSATGHFYVSDEPPRILNQAASGNVRNFRDLGGWRTVDGKVVRQGLVYRSYNFDHGKIAGLPYLSGTLGIGLDLDLRSVKEKGEITGKTVIEAATYVSPIGGGVPRWTCEMDCDWDFPAYSDQVRKDSEPNGQWTFYVAFKKLLGELRAGSPVVFHCVFGKDRTGTFAYLLNGLLGVSADDLELDWCYSWAALSEEYLKSRTLDGLINGLNTYYSAATYAGKMVEYLEFCYTTCGRTKQEADADLAEFRSLMLETPEAPAEKPQTCDHRWSAWSADTATKEAGGSITRTCSECHESQVRQTPQLWDYLMTDDKGYYITDYVPNLAKTRIEMKVGFLSDDHSGMFTASPMVLEGNWTRDLSASMGSARWNDVMSLQLDANVDYYNNSLGGSIHPATGFARTGDTHTYDITGNSFSVDGGTPQSVDGKTAADKSASGPLALLATNFGNGGGFVYTPSRKVYYIRVTTDGTPAMRLRPAKNGTAATLWDEVSGEYLQIANGGVFSVGNDAQEDPDVPGEGMPTLTHPANFAEEATLNQAVKAFNALPTDTKAGMMAGDADSGDTVRASLRKAYKEDLPVVNLAWTGTTGTCFVKVYRECDGKCVFDGKSSTGAAAFWDAEIGRNYRWTVTCGENVATGYFHTEAEAPRLINEKYGRAKNARDLGGWTTVDGTVVRQGILFRTANVDEFEGVGNAYYTGTLGIGFDLDLRAKQELYDDGIAKVGGDIKISPLGAGVVRWNSEDRLGDGVAFVDAYSNIFRKDSTSWQHQKAFWNDFVQLNADANLPAIFHCAAGRDRTGCLAYIMGAVLGVSETDLATDFYTSWASQGYPHDYDKTHKWLPQFVIDLKSKYAGATLREKAEAVLIECCQTSGGNEAQARAEIAKFRARMLELKEAPRTEGGKYRVPVPTAAAAADLVRSGWYEIEANGSVATLTLNDPANACWADGTEGAVKVLAFHVHEWSAWSEDSATKAAGGEQTRHCAHEGCDATETRATPQRWDWLMTDDRGYYITDYVPNLAKTRIEMKVGFLSDDYSGMFTASPMVVGGAKDWTDVMSLQLDENVDYYNNSLGTQIRPSVGFAREGETHTYDITGNSFSVDGGEPYSLEGKTAADKPASGPLAFLVTHFGNSQGFLYHPSRKVYYIRVATDGTSAMRLRPAKDGNGVATLWDEVTGEYLPIANGGVFSVGNDSDETQESIDNGRSGDRIVIPSGKTATLLENGQLKVGDKTYAPKEHYVFKTVDGGFALEIAQEEAVVADISIAADGTVTVTTGRTYDGFWYALEESDALPFEPVGEPEWQKLDETGKLSAEGGGQGGFYRLKVTDRGE